MATKVPPKKNVAYSFHVPLPSQANTKVMQSNPTIAAGDFKVSIDGGALNNLATLPSVEPAGSKLVLISLSASEMNGDEIMVVCSDASGSEWCDVVVKIDTTARQIDDLAYPTTSGRSLDVTATGAAGIDWGNVENPTTVVGLSGTTVKTATDVEADTVDIQGRLPAALVSGRMDSNVQAAADGVLTAAKFASGAFDAVWSVAARTLTAFSFSVTVGTNNDKSGYSLSAAGIQAIWDALTSALTTAGSIGKLLVDNINATISSRLASASYTTPPSVADILAGVIEGSITLKGALRLALAALTGKASGGGTTTVIFRDTGDTKARITATVDSSGNRTAVTRDITD